MITALEICALIIAVPAALVVVVCALFWIAEAIEEMLGPR